jgi:hypothetical protein
VWINQNGILNNVQVTHSKTGKRKQKKMKKERTTENKKKMAELSPNINNIK